VLTSYNDVSERIVWIMNHLQLTQNQLAKKLKVTQPAVSKYLKGRVPPPFVLLELAKISGKTIEWILSGNENYNSETGKVAESNAYYGVEKTLEEKMLRLPTPIKKSFETMVESILKELGIQ